MTDPDLDDRVRDWLRAREPGMVPETLRTAAGHVPYELRRPILSRLVVRWLPMTDVRSPLGATRLSSWRIVGLLALLLLLVLAVGVLLVGGWRTRLPEPYGPAANGLIAYAANGDIYTVDSATGQSRPIVTGPETDADPVWSLDGTRLVFQRTTAGETGGRLYTARADGSGLTLITPEPLSFVDSYGFSPVGLEVMFISGPRGQITIANSDGSGIRTLDLGVSGSCEYTNGCEPTYRPPDGAEILFVGGGNRGLYLVNADGSDLRTLVEPTPDIGVIAPRWSPDGSTIAYAQWGRSPSSLTVRTHIMAADGTGDRTLPAAPNAVWDGRPVWSNDGTRLVIFRGYGPQFERVVAAVVSADAGGLGVETDPSALVPNNGIHNVEWAPDDTSILVTPFDAGGRPAQQILIDPATGHARHAPWATASGPSWQRIAP